MLLGDILAQARRTSADLQHWLGSADPDLMTRVEAAAAQTGETSASFVRIAMADFDRFAKEEDWATLTSSLRNTDDPGRACVTGMVKWRLSEAPSTGERQGDVGK